MRKSFKILHIVHSTLFILLFAFIRLSKLTFGQELIWNHTGGPMGGIIGGMDINSKGDIYAGVYPFMIAYTGLYKSIDNGDNWQKIETQFEDFQVFSLYITKEDHIWVGTDYQGRLYRSTDNGQTWENKANGYNANECWAIGESKDGVLFAGDANSGQLFRSIDNGENWQLSALIAPLVFAVDSNNVVYAGTFSGLYSSTDDGVTWTQNNFLSGYAVSTVLIDTSNGIYCGTGYSSLSGDGLFFSNDGGQTWRQLGLAGKEVLSLAFDSDWNLFVGTLEEGLFKTTDMGQNWIQYENGIYNKEVYRLLLNQGDDIFIGSEGGGNGWYFYGGGGVFRSTNSGDLFVQVGLPISLVKNIVFSGDSLILASTPSGVQKYNRVEGKWKNLGLHNVEAVTITPTEYLYAATRDDGLYKSTDLGNNWFLTNLTIDTLMPVFNVLAINDDILFAATGADMYLRKSTNGGQNWNILPVRTGEWEKGLFFNDTTLFAIGVSSGNNVLYKSLDYGESFESLYSGFTTFELNKPIYALNNGYIFLASNGSGLFGVIRSQDNGLNWDQLLFREHLVPTIFAREDGLVISGTFVSSISDTNKVLVSTNFGNTWTEIEQPTSWGIYITDINQDDQGNFFFGTSGNGLYKVDIITDVKENLSTELRMFNLKQNFPNPFNPVTIIRYELPEWSFVTIILFDVLGKEIATLISEEKPAGSYEVEFNGSDLASGIYFYQLKAGDFINTKKMILLK